MVMILVLLPLFLSCSIGTGGEIKVTLCIISDERTDSGYELHLLLYHTKSEKSAIIKIPGPTVINGVTAEEHGRTTDVQVLEEILEDLLELDIDYVVSADIKEAFALFTILDSLEAFDLNQENGYVGLYDSRWATLYRNAKLLASDQVIEKILILTEDIPDRKVKDFLLSLGDKDDNEPNLIEYQIDMYDRPLYNGMYGKELINDILRRLE